MLAHGKTIVSIIAAYKAVKSGYQMTIMAPTAILAAQHMKEYCNILDKFGIKCELLVSGISKKKKEDILQRLADGQIDIWKCSGEVAVGVNHILVASPSLLHLDPFIICRWLNRHPQEPSSQELAV